jgi:hypothetical protein
MQVNGSSSNTARLTWLAVLGLCGVPAGCGSAGNSGKDGNIGVILVEEEAPAPELELTVDATAVMAGEAVGWSLSLVYEDGSTEPVSGTIESDLEALHFGPEAVMLPRVAGTHLLTATAPVDGVPESRTAELVVTVAPTAAVDLVVSDQAFVAGGSIDWAIEARDQYGNIIETAGALPNLGDAPLRLVGSTITGTLPGAYSVDAELDGVFDTEVLVVVPGEAAEVSLSLSDTALEVFETTSATVTIADEYGNTVAAPWSLSVTGTDVTTDDYAISWNNVTFYSEGAFTVRVDVDGTALFDEVGPLLIDSTGPEIIIDSPERGDWNDGLEGSLSGTVTDAYSGVGALTANGAVVSVESDGSFDEALDFEFGTNVVETVAVDGDGNVSTDTRAVLAGDFLTWEAPVENGFMVRLADGEGGLGTLEVLGEELVSDIDLTALIPNPVFSEEDRDCISTWFGTYCFTWYALTLRVDQPSFGAVDLELDTRATGALVATMTVNDIYLRWVADATVTEIDFSGNGDITADKITVDLTFFPSVDSDGNIDLGLSSVDASTSNFYFDWDSWLYDALEFFGLDASISSLLEGFVEDALEDTVESAVPPLLDDALSDLEIVFDLELQGVTYAIDAIPSDIDIDARMLLLELATTVGTDTWVKPDAGLGSLEGGYDVLLWPTTAGTHLGMNLDFMNQFFLATWGGGLLDMEMDAAELGLDVSDLDFLLPGLTDLTITTEALLPPVVVPDGVDAMLELQVGDLLLTLYNGDATVGNEMIQVYVTAFVEMDLDAASDGTSLNPELGDMDLHFDVVIPEANTVGAADTEALLELLVPLLLPTLTDALTEVPIPDIQGFGISGVSVEAIGAGDGVIAIGGDLVVR